MSLQIWLPLNGNLNNQGLSNINVINNGATVDNNGKIGKCYKCSGDSRISFPSFNWMTMKPQNNFSFFFWAKGTTNGWLFACSAWEFRLCPGYIQIHLNGDGRYPARYTSTFDTNTWYHLGFTWSGSDGKLLLYLNGSKVAESNVPSSANYDIASIFNLPYDGPRYLNDIRIYDHCLSPKEVKELAKGLILHYRLTGPGQANLLHSEKPITNIASNIAINNDLTCDLTYASAIKDTCLFFNLIETIIGGETYTLSFNCSGVMPSDTITFSYGNVPSTGIFKLHNGYNVCTFTKSTSEKRDFFDDQTRITDGTHNIRLSNFKLEKGSIATPWCPSVTDFKYNVLGYNNIEYDCSGYCRNGTKIGNITWDIDSPRYTTSYKMISSNVGTNTNSGMTIIYSNDGLTTPSTITIAFWLKPIKWNYQNSGLLSTTMESYPTDYTVSAINQYDSVFRFNASDGSSLNISATSLVNDFLWHHYSFVFDGINVKVYKDGALTNLGKSFSSTKTLGSFKRIFIGLS